MWSVLRFSCAASGKVTQACVHYHWNISPSQRGVDIFRWRIFSLCVRPGL